MTYKNSAQILLDGEQQALAYSRFLQRNFFVDSELRQWIIDHCLSSSWQAGLIRSEVNECLSEISNKQQLYVQMRVLRRRYLSLIAWADLSGVYCLESTIAAVSELADSLIDNGLQHLKTAMTERYGEPIDTASSSSCNRSWGSVWVCKSSRICKRCSVLRRNR